MPYRPEWKLSVRLPCRWYEAKISPDAVPLRLVRAAELLNWLVVKCMSFFLLDEMPAYFEDIFILVMKNFRVFCLFVFVTIVTITLWEHCLLTIKYVRWFAAIRFLTIILKTLWWFSEAHGLIFLIFPELWIAILQLLLLYYILLINCHGMKIDELSKVTTLLLTFFQSTNMDYFFFS